MQRTLQYNIYITTIIKFIMTLQQSDIIFLPLASICTKLKLTIKFMTLFFIVSGVTAIGTALSENGGLLNHYFNSLMSYGTLFQLPSLFIIY